MAPLGGKECRILGAGIDGKKPKAVAVFASLEQVRILLCVCSHIAMYVSSCCCICVRILLYVCPHTAVYVSSYCSMCVRILLCMCPHPATSKAVAVFVSLEQVKRPANSSNETC